ncbi:MAG TPA: SMC-Scp complex subunit ScpB [Parasegetibacter sp.]
MEISEIIPHIEALVFASDKPLTNQELTDLINNAFGFMEDKITIDQIDAALEGIQEKYSAEFYPFEVRESGGGWQFLTKKEFHKTVAQLNGDKFLKRLSGAAMETLAIIAYRQPITKSEIEAIRGVSCDYAIQKLLEKDLVVIAGRNEELPGKPLIYQTSRSFMDYFGINSPDELPKIKEVLADQVVEPSVVNEAGEAIPSDNDDEADISSAPLVVNETGELLEGTNQPEDLSVDDSSENLNNQSDDPETAESTSEEPGDVEMDADENEEYGGLNDEEEDDDDDDNDDEEEDDDDDDDEEGEEDDDEDD